MIFSRLFSFPKVTKTYFYYGQEANWQGTRFNKRVFFSSINLGQFGDLDNLKSPCDKLVCDALDKSPIKVVEKSKKKLRTNLSEI